MIESDHHLSGLTFAILVSYSVLPASFLRRQVKNVESPQSSARRRDAEPFDLSSAYSGTRLGFDLSGYIV